MADRLSFSGRGPLRESLAILQQEVADADAAFQIAQQARWNALLATRPLLAGADRLANLGLARVEVKLALVPLRLSWLRRLYAWLFTRAGAPASQISYRFARPDEAATALKLTVVIQRGRPGGSDGDGQDRQGPDSQADNDQADNGVWTTTLVDPGGGGPGNIPAVGRSP
jgi:hypothetical protein